MQLISFSSGVYALYFIPNQRKGINFARKTHLQSKSFYYAKDAANVVMMPVGEDDGAYLYAGVLKGLAQVVVVLWLLSVSCVD